MEKENAVKLLEKKGFTVVYESGVPIVIYEGGEKEMKETYKHVAAVLEEKGYAAVLEAKGIAPEQIRTYGFAFHGKQVLIRSGISEKP